ncbi:multiple sugar transport system permease protein [Anaerotaenia torta]|uniref:carbohydrate ABC transporter permease n=1 Tax=Anaerotaenia torta TaxID=433293 RepID=UPI003D1BF2F9
MKKHRTSARKSIAMGMKYLSLAFASFVAVVPLIVILLVSFKTQVEFRETGALELPESFMNVENYIRAFVDGKMLRGFTNTAIILVISMIGAILTGTMTAYVLNRFEFRAKKIVKSSFLIAALVPSVTMQVTCYQIMNALHLINTRTSVILLYIGTDIIAIYIFLQFLDNISESLDESAIVDGASYFTVFFKIIMPLLKPAIMTVLIIKGVNIYNDFYTPFLYMTSRKLLVISTSLFNFQGPYGTQWQVICAGIVITILPTLAIFLFLQKYIYSGLTQGSVKG